jgi:hypothetical protein
VNPDTIAFSNRPAMICASAPIYHPPQALRLAAFFA